MLTFKKGKISEVLETCRATGAQRFIATEYLTFYKVIEFKPSFFSLFFKRLLNEAFDKIKSGKFNSIPVPVAQTEDLNPYFDRYVEAKKEYLSFHNFTQGLDFLNYSFPEQNFKICETESSILQSTRSSRKTNESDLLIL